MCDEHITACELEHGEVVEHQPSRIRFHVGMPRERSNEPRTVFHEW